MGLFDSFKPAEPVFNVQKAVMTIVVGAIAADGDVSDDETTRLRSMCARSPIFASNTKEEDNTVIDFAAKVLVQLKEKALDKAAAALKPELKETAFVFATEMILADGNVTEEEDKYISTLAKKLEISDEVGRAVINVTLMRFRGAE